MKTIKRIIRERASERPRPLQPHPIAIDPAPVLGEQTIRVKFGVLSIGEIATLRRTAGVVESTLDPKNRGAALTATRFAELRADANFDRQALFWKAQVVTR